MYENRIYSTLADVPVDSSDDACQNYYLTLPSDWVIAPDNADSISAIRNNRWKTDHMVTSSGRLYYTAKYIFNAGQSAGCCYLEQSGSQYKVSACNFQILILT